MVCDEQGSQLTRVEQGKGYFWADSRPSGRTKLLAVFENVFSVHVLHRLVGKRLYHTLSE